MNTAGAEEGIQNKLLEGLDSNKWKYILMNAHVWSQSCAGLDACRPRRWDEGIWTSIAVYTIGKVATACPTYSNLWIVGKVGDFIQIFNRKACRSQHSKQSNRIRLKGQQWARDWEFEYVRVLNVSFLNLVLSIFENLCLELILALEGGDLLRGLSVLTRFGPVFTRIRELHRRQSSWSVWTHSRKGAPTWV